MILSRASERKTAAFNAPREPRTSDEYIFLALMERLFPSKPPIKVETALKDYDPHQW